MAKNEATETTEATKPKAAKLPQPGPGEKVYAVCYPKDAEPEHVCAINNREAWAKYCDQNKTWPSPKAATVTEVK